MCIRDSVEGVDDGNDALRLAFADDEQTRSLVLDVVRQHQKQSADAANLPGVERALAHALPDDLVHHRAEMGKRHFADGAQKRRVAAAEADV